MIEFKLKQFLALPIFTVRSGTRKGSRRERHLVRPTRAWKIIWAKAGRPGRDPRHRARQIGGDTSRNLNDLSTAHASIPSRHRG